MPEGNSDTPIDRRQQLEEWRRAKAAQQKGTNNNNRKTLVVAGKSTMSSFFFARSTDPSKSVQKTATAPPKSRTAEQRPILNSAAHSVTLPKKRSSPIRPRIIAAQKANVAKSSGPRAIIGTPCKPMGVPSNNAATTNSDELQRRVLRVSAKKMAQIRRKGGDLKMKLGLLSVHTRLLEAELEKKQAKKNIVRNLSEELKAAKAQSSPPMVQKNRNEPSRKQHSSCRSSLSNEPKRKKSTTALAEDATNLINISDGTSTNPSPPPPASTTAALARVSRLTKEEFNRINTAIENLNLYQPVALRINQSAVEPITDAKLLNWFCINDARIAAIQGRMKLARAMLWILGAQPLQTNTVETKDINTSKHVWPYQQTEYWIARGKFEEACGEINEAFYVYEEAMSALPHSTDAFKHAHQEFTDRMARSGFYMDKNKPRVNYPASDANKSISTQQRRDQLQAQLELVFKTSLQSSLIITLPTPNTDTKSPLSSYSMSPPMDICCVQPVAELSKVTTVISISNDPSNDTGSPQSREEKKRLAQASDDGELSSIALKALSLVPDEDNEDDDKTRSSVSETEQVAEPANDPSVTVSITTITSNGNTNGAKDEASRESDEENNAPTTDSVSKTPEKSSNTRRRPRTPEETSPNERPLRRIRSTGNRRKQKLSDILVSTFTALTPVRASKGQQSEYGVHTVISPVRRSTRLLPKDIEGITPILAETDSDALTSKSNDEQRLAQLLHEQGFAYIPNKALSLSAVKVDKLASSSPTTNSETASQP